MKIASTKGERYLDVAWPIFEGKAGILRLGFSERPYRRKMTRLWFQMIGFTLAILLLSVTGTLLFIRRVTRPLEDLTKAAKKIDEGEQGIRVRVPGQDQVRRLADSFNHRIARIEERTRKLEDQTMELERAHHQTRTFCGIVQEIGALRSLKEMGGFLINRMQEILKCTHMRLLLFGSNQESLFLLSSRELKIFEE